MNSTLLISVVFILVFGYLYFYYNRNHKSADKFINVSTLVDPDLSFIRNNDFLSDITVVDKNKTTFDTNYSSNVLNNLRISSDKMAMSKILMDKVLLDNLIYKRDKNANNLIYKLSKRPVVY